MQRAWTKIEQDTVAAANQQGGKAVEAAAAKALAEKAKSFVQEQVKAGADNSILATIIISSPTLRKALGISSDARGVRVRNEEKRGKFTVTITPIIHIDKDPAHDQFGARIVIRF